MNLNSARRGENKTDGHLRSVLRFRIKSALKSYFKCYRNPGESMDISSEKEKINIDAKMHAAETFYSMGLFTEAIDAYKEIVKDIPDLDENKKKHIKEKIDSIQKELGEMDHKEVTDLTDKELSLIKKTLTSKGHDNISQLLNSGYALRELGLYEEALNEYQKLFSLDYPKIKILIEILECLLKIHTHAEVVQKIQEMMTPMASRGVKKTRLTICLVLKWKSADIRNLHRIY
jgi:tetratricopeptide (TPR) repeat protein